MMKSITVKTHMYTKFKRFGGGGSWGGAGAEFVAYFPTA